MTTIYIALGSNKGSSLILVQKALSELSKLGSDFQASKLYETAPIDCEGGPFINAVCSFETDISLNDFIPILENIEKSLGKTAKTKAEARFIDLDILFYGSLEYCLLGYTIPHPAWQERGFVLTPLSDIIEEITIAGKSFKIKDLCKKLS